MINEWIQITHIRSLKTLTPHLCSLNVCNAEISERLEDSIKNRHNTQIVGGDERRGLGNKSSAAQTFRNLVFLSSTISHSHILQYQKTH